MEVLDELGQLVLAALRLADDAAVRGVAHVAREAADLLRRFDGRGAEEDALDAARYLEGYLGALDGWWGRGEAE